MPPTKKTKTVADCMKSILKTYVTKKWSMDDEDSMISADDVFDDEDEDMPMRPSHNFEAWFKEAMTVLVEHNLADFLLLKNDKLREWWAAEVKKDLAAQARREAKERKRQLKEQAIGKLSDEELEALGLKRK